MGCPLGLVLGFPCVFIRGGLCYLGVWWIWKLRVSCFYSVLLCFYQGFFFFFFLSFYLYRNVTPFCSILRTCFLYQVCACVACILLQIPYVTNPKKFELQTLHLCLTYCQSLTIKWSFLDLVITHQSGFFCCWWIYSFVTHKNIIIYLIWVPYSVGLNLWPLTCRLFGSHLSAVEPFFECKRNKLVTEMLVRW